MLVCVCVLIMDVGVCACFLKTACSVIMKSATGYVEGIVWYIVFYLLFPYLPVSVLYSFDVGHLCCGGPLCLETG